MSLTTFSWMMHGNDEGLVDDKRQISVNWVVPTGEITAGDAPPDGQTVIDTVGSLLWPWQMRITGWALISEGKLTLVTPVPPTTLTDPLGLQEKMADEIRQSAAVVSSRFPPTLRWHRPVLVKSVCRTCLLP